jgi:hypothetical protein
MRRLLAKGGGRSAATRADDWCCTANRLWWARSELPQASRILTRRRVLLKLLVSGLEIRESFEMETGGISLVHMIRFSQPLPIGVATPWMSAANRSDVRCSACCKCLSTIRFHYNLIISVQLDPKVALPKQDKVGKKSGGI